MKELLETLKDPAALAQFIGMAAAMVALKKAACKAGVTPAANLAFSVYQGAQTGLTAFQVKTLLSRQKGVRTLFGGALSDGEPKSGQTFFLASSGTSRAFEAEAEACRLT